MNIIQNVSQNLSNRLQVRVEHVDEIDVKNTFYMSFEYPECDVHHLDLLYINPNVEALAMFINRHAFGDVVQTAKLPIDKLGQYIDESGDVPVRISTTAKNDGSGRTLVVLECLVDGVAG